MRDPLSTKSYVPFIQKAQLRDYKITLLYFWLSSPDMAFERVAKRVSKGGHNIPIDVIERRYYRGINNLIKLYMPICDECIIVDNRERPEIVAEYANQLVKVIINNDIWETILIQGNDNKQ